MTTTDLLLAAEFLILSSFLTVPVGLLVAGYLFGADTEPRHAAPPFAVNSPTDASTWLVRDHKRHRELVNAYQGGER